MKYAEVINASSAVLFMCKVGKVVQPTELKQTIIITCIYIYMYIYICRVYLVCMYIHVYVCAHATILGVHF